MSDVWWSVPIAAATVLLLSLLKATFGPEVTWVVASCVLSFCVGALWGGVAKTATTASSPPPQS